MSQRVFFLSLVFPTVSLAADADNDGYDAVLNPRDCNDQLAAINPNAEELPGDGIDQDCDKNDTASHRLDVHAFSQPAWSWTGQVSWNGDAVTIGGPSGGSVSRVFNRFIPHGRVRAAVAVEARTGTADCALAVRSVKTPGGPIQTGFFPLSATGNLLSPLLALHPAPRSIAQVSITCPAGSSVQVDWLSLVSAATASGPIDEAAVGWKDIESPGGGLTSSVVRSPVETGPSGSWYGVTSDAYMASDLGGVARFDPSTLLWETINGSGSTGLTTQAALAVWDILPSVDGSTLLALTGRYETDTYYAGGLWKSTDLGDTWTLVADSDATDANEEVGGRGRYGFCDDHPYSGGRLLIEEMDTPTYYVANGDPDNLGVTLYDDTEVCDLPGSSTLPSDGHIRAMARLYLPTYDSEALVVGYAARGATDPSLYICELPESDLDSDGHEEVDLSCSGSTSVTCTAMNDSEGMDVRDIEVDPIWPFVFYVADSGMDETCSAWSDPGEVTVWFSDDDTSTAETELLGAIVMPSGFDSVHKQRITGIAVDPDWGFLYAFFPATHDKAYDVPRAFRLPIDAMITGSASDWESFNGTDEALREEYMAPQDSWLGWDDDLGMPATWPIQMKKDPYPARWTPANGIDATFIGTYAGSSESYAMLIGTDSNAWVVWGAMGDTDGTWDPDTSTNWMFVPSPDLDNDLTFQTSVANDVAMDSEGRIWVATQDLGVFMQESTEHHAALDCLWDNYSAGGGVVSIDTDNGVWIGLHDQSGSAPFHEIGLFHTEDGGSTWEYEGAGFEYGTSQRDYDGFSAYYPYCKDKDTTHEATPMSATGLAFSDNEVDVGLPTWGNLIDVEAIDSDVVFALFSDGASDGRLSYSVEGGASWTAVAFDGDWTHSTSTGACSESTFFAGVNGMAAVLPGSTTVGVDTGGTAAPDTVDATLYISSRYNPGYDPSTSTNEPCGLAKVVIDDGEATWSWPWLQRDYYSQSSCQLDEANILGVSAPAWTGASGVDVVYVWGAYSHIRVPDLHLGGACTLRVDNDTATQLVSPASYRMTVGEVAPSPTTTDWLFVAGRQDVYSTLELYESTSTPELDPSRPLLIDTSVGPATIVELTSTPPNLVGTAAGWGEYDGAMYLLYGTEGSGAWRGTMTW